MDNSLSLCRLCFVKVEEGINIFKKSKITKNFADDLLDLLQISVSIQYSSTPTYPSNHPPFQLEEKYEWPNGACKKCIDFISEIKSFREKVLATQETLLNGTPATEPFPPPSDDYFGDALSSDESVEEDKTGIKSEANCDLMGARVIIEPLPNLPSRRTTRISKRPQIPQDTVTTFDNSSEDEEPLPANTSKRTKAEQQDEEEDKAAILYRQQITAKKPRKPREPRNNANTLEDLDLLVRRENRLMQQERRKKRSFEEKEASRKHSVVMWERKFKNYAHLEPIIEELKLKVCDVCKVEQESLGALFSHQEREHDILRHKGYVICCKRRFENTYVLDHCMYHADKDTFKCPVEDCGKQCKSKAHMRKHQKQKHTAAEYKCSKCPKAFTEARALELHESRHLVYKYSCRECTRCKDGGRN